MNVDYAMLIEPYGTPSDRTDTRYSPPLASERAPGILSGNPDRDPISTLYRLR